MVTLRRPDALDEPARQFEAAAAGTALSADLEIRAAASWLRAKHLSDVGEVLLELRPFISAQRLVRGRGERRARVFELAQSYFELCAIEVGSGLLHGRCG